MSAPLVVNTKDGTCWTRRTVTSGGIALYAPESVKTCPEFVMATEAELAEHGIVGSAFALPMPVAPEPQEDPVAAGRRLDLLALMDERAASAVSPVLAGVLDEAERLRASRWDATKVVAQMESKLLAMHGELTRATERVAELEAAAVEGRAALAAFCHDHQDPGTAALGALYLLQQATPGTPMEPGETVPKVYRASHDSIVMGLYTTREAARAHCETVLRHEIGDKGVLGWIPDDGSDLAPEELSVFGPDEDEDGPEETCTGYVVTPLEVAAAYDPDGDE